MIRLLIVALVVLVVIACVVALIVKLKSSVSEHGKEQRTKKFRNSMDFKGNSDISLNPYSDGGSGSSGGECGGE